MKQRYSESYNMMIYVLDERQIELYRKSGYTVNKPNELNDFHHMYRDDRNISVNFDSKYGVFHISIDEVKIKNTKDYDDFMQELQKARKLWLDLTD